MSKQEPAPWLDLNEAAALSGKSLSTLRRLVSGMAQEEAAEHLRREPLKDKGGEKILISAAYLRARYNLPESQQEPQQEEGGEDPPSGVTSADLVQILERQLDQKDKQIAALQREAEAKSRQLELEQQTASDLSESLRQFAALNAVLQNKILALTERAGETAAPADPVDGRRAGMASPFYFVAVAVALSLIAGLLLYLILF